MTDPKRVNQGIPAGGQFAAEHRGEPEGNLPEPALSLELVQALDADLESLSQQDAYGNDLAMEQMEAEAAEIRQYGVDFDGTYLRHRGPHSGVPINGGFVRLWGRHTPETPALPVAATEPEPYTPVAEPMPPRTQAAPAQRSAAPKRKRQGFLKQMMTRELRSTINRAIGQLFR